MFCGIKSIVFKIKILIANYLKRNPGGTPPNLVFLTNHFEGEFDKYPYLHATVTNFWQQIHFLDRRPVDIPP